MVQRDMPGVPDGNDDLLGAYAFGADAFDSADDLDEADAFGERVDAAIVESVFVELEYGEPPADAAAFAQRLQDICTVWPSVSTPHEYLKLAHYLADDSSVAAQELHDAALRTAWRVRTAASDPWEDAWWFEAVDDIADRSRAQSLRRWVADQQTQT